MDHHNLTLNWDISEEFAVKVIGGYRDSTNELSADLDGMDNSANGGVIGDLPLSTIGGLLFNQVVPDSIPIAPGVDLGLGAGDEFLLALNVIGAINAYGGAPVFNNYAKTDYEQTSLRYSSAAVSTISITSSVSSAGRMRRSSVITASRRSRWRPLTPPPTILIRKRHQSSVRRPGALVTWR